MARCKDKQAILKELTENNNLKVFENIKRIYYDASIQMQQKCPYEKFGCREKTISLEVDHIKKCSYRPIKCHHKNNVICDGQEIDYDVKSILTHLQTVHDISVEEQHDGFISSFEWTNNLLTTNGKINAVFPSTEMQSVYTYKNKYFFKNSKTQDGIRYWWFSILGSEEHAKKFKACLRIKKIDGEKQKVQVPQWVLPVVSVRRTLSEVIQMKKYASLKLTLKTMDYLGSLRTLGDENKNPICKSYGWCTEVQILQS